MSPALVHLLTPLALPFACAWVERQQRIVLAQGVALSPAEVGDAGQIGVRFPERVRLLKVGRVPLPQGTVLRGIARAAGVLSTPAAGLTVGYGILVDAAHWRERLLIAHELVHVMQYERLGGVRPFLREYIADCLRCGYTGASLELEAAAVAVRVVTDEWCSRRADRRPHLPADARPVQRRLGHPVHGRRALARGLIEAVAQGALAMSPPALRRGSP